jgi:hypothetical protein
LDFRHCVPMRAQVLCAFSSSGAAPRLKSGRLARPGSQALCASVNSGAVRLRGFMRRAPVEVWAPCAPLDFGHCVPMRAQALCAFSRSGAAHGLKSGRLARPGSQALCATVNSSAVRLREFRHRAPVEIRAPCAPLDFRHCVPMLAEALCAFSNSGAARRLKSGRLARPGSQALRATVNSGAVRLREFSRRAPVEIRAPCAPLDFRHCVPMRAQALCTFSSSGAARRLPSGRLARPGSQALCATVNSGAVRLREFRRRAPVEVRAPCAPLDFRHCVSMLAQALCAG